jgi:hypothetical protein
MNKFLGFFIVVALMLFCPLALAQHGHSGGSGGGGGHASTGGNHSNNGGAQSRQAPRQQTQARPQGHFYGDGGHHVTAETRSHFDGRHFDHEYYGTYFGREHHFRMEYRVWGGRGWRFWYGGWWFDYYDPWPYDWCYCDDFYIEYSADDDCYFMYNYMHPGLRLRIGVVF